MSKNVPTPTEIPKPPKFKVKNTFDRKKYLRKRIANLEYSNKKLTDQIVYYKLLLNFLFAIIILEFICLVFIN